MDILRTSEGGLTPFKYAGVKYAPVLGRNYFHGGHHHDGEKRSSSSSRYHDGEKRRKRPERKVFHGIKPIFIASHSVYSTPVSLHKCRDTLPGKKRRWPTIARGQIKASTSQTKVRQTNTVDHPSAQNCGLKKTDLYFSGFFRFRVQIQTTSRVQIWLEDHLRKTRSVNSLGHVQGGTLNASRWPLVSIPRLLSH